MAESCTATRGSDLDETMLPDMADADARERSLAWLATEFPTWSIEVDVTAGWDGEERDLWVAEQDGHHPQRALSAAKLHTRLDEYQERERLRRSFTKA